MLGMGLVKQADRDTYTLGCDACGRPIPCHARHDRTRIMTQPQLYKTVGATVTKVWAEEGAGAFFKGTAPRLLHKVPANAIFFATYELFRALLRVQG